MTTNLSRFIISILFIGSLQNEYLEASPASTKKDFLETEYFCAYIKKFDTNFTTIAFTGKTSENYIDNFIKFMKSPLFSESIKIKMPDGCWTIRYKIKNNLLNEKELNTLIEQANQHLLGIIKINIKLQEECSIEEASKVTLKQLVEAERIKTNAQLKAVADAKRAEEEMAAKHKINVQNLIEQNQLKYKEWKNKNKQNSYDDQFYVFALPNNFHITCERPLNELGQIVGTTNYSNVAIWDATNGIKDFAEAKGIPGAINDRGCFALNLNSNARQINKHQIAFWNSNTNVYLLGPLGKSFMINNKNTILFGCDNQRFIYRWNPDLNTIETLSNNVSYIDDSDKTHLNNGHPYFSNFSAIDFNQNGNILFSSPAGISLYCNQRHHPIAFNGTKLNNKDEVAAIIDNKIFIWKKNGSTFISKPLFEIIKWIEGYNVNDGATGPDQYSKIEGIEYCIRFKIISFNSSGQILIELGLFLRNFQSPPTKSFLFLLMPK